MKGKGEKIHAKMVYKRQSARERTGLNSRQIKRQTKRECKCRNKVENKVENNIKSSKSKVKKLLICRWTLTIFGVFCALISSYFEFFSSDTTSIPFFDLTVIFVFCIVLDLFLYLKK